MVDPKSPTQTLLGPGPFRSDQIRSGDPYELSRGHAILVAPTGRAGALRQGLAFQVLASDPDAVGVAIDPGISPEPGTLRAPDVALGITDGRGWESQIPPLAVEYADRGQDEVELQAKIEELLALGTRHLWVVRLDGPRRVEVHEPGRPMRIVDTSGTLEAPGLLRNSVPVSAFFDREVADHVTFRNLLQREGFDSLEAVLDAGREEGRTAGREEGRAVGQLESRRALLVDQLEHRFGALPVAARNRIANADMAALERLGRAVITAPGIDDALATLG